MEILDAARLIVHGGEDACRKRGSRSRDDEHGNAGLREQTLRGGITKACRAAAAPPPAERDEVRAEFAAERRQRIRRRSGQQLDGRAIAAHDARKTSERAEQCGRELLSDLLDRWKVRSNE